MNDATRKLLNLPLSIEAYLPPREDHSPDAPEQDYGELPTPIRDDIPTPVRGEPVEPPNIADIIREETDDGRTVVKFLVSAMQDELDDFKPCHRLDAARQLVKFGFDPAQSFLDTYMSIEGPAPTHTRASAAAEPAHEIHPDLARIVAEETQDGRTTVRFLVQVMQGELPEFKPHHRINSAKELLRLGFPTKVEEAEPEAESKPDLMPDRYFTLSDGTIVTYEGHDPTCDCHSGLTDCLGVPRKDIDKEPVGIKGRAERAAFDAAFPDYVPPTDSQKGRIVAEYIHLRNLDAPKLKEVPLPFVREEANKLFERDRRERAEGKSFPSWWDFG